MKFARLRLPFVQTRLSRNKFKRCSFCERRNLAPEEYAVKYAHWIAAGVSLMTLTLVSPASATLGMAPLTLKHDTVIQVKGGHGHGHGHHGWHRNRGHHYGWYIGRGNRRHHH
jgi:hypothetical protein